ncbi:MAG TPA: FtsH protease activity modulator HflK [Beijerinckiaceae bacterium]|nr:FtsH protease activity modulator HflK [Beijerinckiaceae bacterium]
MPWSNQNGGGGPWGRPPNGPSSRGPGPGGPPDLESLMRRGQNGLRRLAPGGLGGRTLWIIGAALVAIWLASGFYTVGPNQVGLNLVFGRYVAKTAPGLNYNWPYPIGSVDKPTVTDRNAIDIGFARSGSHRNSGVGLVSDVPSESLMLTGDQNIADVKFRVIWQIDPVHPADYVFDVRHPRKTVKAVSESAMSEIVGHTPIQGLLTADRSKIEPAAQTFIQNILDQYKAGVKILQVQLLPVDPPQQVIAAFKDVTVAQQDKDRLQNVAQAYANKVVPEARGNAARIIQDAEAYRSQTVAQARGQASRFDQIYQAYKAAPAVTRERMYLETMQKVLGGANKIILDQKSGHGVLPYLPLAALGPTGAKGSGK